MWLDGTGRDMSNASKIAGRLLEDEDFDPKEYAMSLPTPRQKITAVAINDHTGDELKFNGIDWFISATQAQLIALAKEDFEMCELADDVAWTAALKNLELSRFLKDCEEGYEVYVNREDVLKYLKRCRFTAYQAVSK
jgi:hypothetical protein